MPRYRDHKGRFVGGPIEKGINDSTFGSQITQEANSPKAIKNIARALTPTEAYQLCSAVRTSILARNEPFNQGKIRIFDQSGREYVGGPINSFWAAPNPSMSGPMLLQYISSWNDMTGERVSWTHEDNTTNGKKYTHPLNPIGLRIMKPLMPRVPEDIEQWQYIWDTGATTINTPVIQLIDADEITFQHDFNPSSLVRGTSPLISVINSITAYYQSQRYIRSFFSNNARPSQIIHLETDNQDQVTPFKTEFERAHQGDTQAWLSFFTYGGKGSKVSVTPLEAPISEAPFQELLRNVRNEVSALYMVPPLHGGMWDQTRFDSVEEQNRFFYESVFIPRGETMQRYCQLLTDKQLRLEKGHNFRACKFTKSMGDRFEKARMESNSNFVVILDFDHIPAVAQLKKFKIEYAQELQDTFHITPREAANEVGLDLALNESSDLVWFKSDQKYIEHVKQGQVPITPLEAASKPDNIAPEMPEVPAEQAVADEGSVDAQEKPSIENEETSEAVDRLKGFYRSLRKLTLDKIDQNSHWTLSEADELAKKHECFSVNLRKEIRADYRNVRDMKADKAMVKSYFNTKKPSYLRSITQ